MKQNDLEVGVGLGMRRKQAASPSVRPTQQLGSVHISPLHECVQLLKRQLFPTGTCTLDAGSTRAGAAVCACALAEDS